MIINGGSRSNGVFFARHLMRADQNERLSVAEIRGLAAQDVREAFREMEAVASGTRCKNFFYHANLNPREGEQLTPEQWELAEDMLERELGLTGQPRVVVEHEKDGRTHRHVVWSRIDADSMTAISDSLTYPKHERAARAIEQACGHETVESVLVKDRGAARPSRNPQDWESFRGQDSKLDPKAIKAQVTELWYTSDNGAAFAAALQAHGYILAKGDRRDFCIIDQAGDEHALARRIEGVKAAELRARMVDIDRDQLPSVAQAREQARQAASGDAALPPLPLGRQEAPRDDTLIASIPEITPELEREFSARWEGWQPLARTAHADLSTLEVATPAAVDEERRGWRRFVDRMRAFQARLAEFWHDETDGVPEGERGFAARLLDTGRKLVDGYRHRSLSELKEGAQMASGLAHEGAADPPDSAPSHAKDKPSTSWVERVREVGCQFLHSERGSIPGDKLDRYAQDWVPEASPGDTPDAEPPDAIEPDTPDMD